MNSAPTESDRLSDPSHPAVAPAWHTLVILTAIFSLSLIGALNHDLSPMGKAHNRAQGYIAVMAFEWIIVAFIAWGIKRRGMRIADLVGGRWVRAVEIRRDIVIGVAFLLICGVALLNGLGYLLKATPNQAIRNLFPSGPAQTVLYLLLALTAGFCEEVIFRGYFQRQFAALTRSAAGGIVLQGVAFGMGHGYQGWKFMSLIAVYGITFGLLAHWRRSLRPGMIAHFVQDGVGGLLAKYLMR